MSLTLRALPSSRGDVDPIEVLRERLAQAQDRHRRALNDRGYASVVTYEPTDAALRAARTSFQLEALAISYTRPVNFAAASRIKPRRYPRFATR